MYILTKKEDNSIYAVSDTENYIKSQPNGVDIPVKTMASATHATAEGESYPVSAYLWREVETIPENMETNGTWVFYLDTKEIVQDEGLTSEKIRQVRDEKITETDWMLVLDSPFDGETQEKVKEYRQKLRDIPQQEGFPFEVEFPVLEEETKEEVSS